MQTMGSVGIRRFSGTKEQAIRAYQQVKSKLDEEERVLVLRSYYNLPFDDISREAVAKCEMMATEQYYKKFALALGKISAQR